MKLSDIALLKIEQLDSEQLERLGREEWKAAYINRGRFGILLSHDDQEVMVWEDRFEHAFFESGDFRRRQFAKERLSADRIARIPWIGPLIRGEVDDMECYEVPSNEGRLRPPNRLYLSWAGLYGCFLEPRQNTGWKFSTAYTASAEYWRTRCRLGQKVPKKIKPRD